MNTTTTTMETDIAYIDSGSNTYGIGSNAWIIKSVTKRKVIVSGYDSDTVKASPCNFDTVRHPSHGPFCICVWPSSLKFFPFHPVSVSHFSFICIANMLSPHFVHKCSCLSSFAGITKNVMVLSE